MTCKLCGKDKPLGVTEPICEVCLIRFRTLNGQMQQLNEYMTEAFKAFIEAAREATKGIQAFITAWEASRTRPR